MRRSPCASYVPSREDRRRRHRFRVLYPGRDPCVTVYPKHTSCNHLGNHSSNLPADCQYASATLNTTPTHSCSHPYYATSMFGFIKATIDDALEAVCVYLNVSPFTNSSTTPPPAPFNMPTRLPGSLSRDRQSQAQGDEPFELDRSYPPAQVVQTRRLLQRTGLPVEVVDTILDLAEYWPAASTITQYASEKVARSAYETGNSAHLLYLRTPPLPGEFKPESTIGGGAAEGFATGRFIGRYQTRGQHPARKIVFKTVSRDQGWTSNEGRDTYKGSWSWFEVHAERPKSIGAITPAEHRPLVDAEVMTKTKTSDYNNSPWKRVSATKKGVADENRSPTSNPEEKITWDLQRNVHAGQDWKTHWVVWKHDGPDSGPVDESTGAGAGADLIRCLKPGDRINLVARAQFPGWQNCVRSAEVHVYYAI
ncbi:unnamed protein product [Tuber aestivum]|uniref:Uncharacterized protein n=1 Tax=Tuber aestivum TaxID=59557 RepID=A0A292Q1I7_9PEZI|nr:unnamed protein product [Tuber aestivum]